MNTREVMQQALEALELGYDAAKAEADQYHAAMAGYRPQRHAKMDADAQKIAAAITALRAALAEPNDDYERGFIDGMKKQAQSSVDKAVNGLALPTCKDHLQVEPVAWRVKVGTTDRFGNRTEMIDYNEMGIGEPLYTAPQPCPTCESLARAVMLDQTGRA